MQISISLCPTNMEIGGDILDEDAVLSMICEAVEGEYPDATITTLQVGYRQGDEWYQIDGEDSDELQQFVNALDFSDEGLYRSARD